MKRTTTRCQGKPKVDFDPEIFLVAAQRVVDGENLFLCRAIKDTKLENAEQAIEFMIKLYRADSEWNGGGTYGWWTHDGIDLAPETREPRIYALLFAYEIAMKGVVP